MDEKKLKDQYIDRVMDCIKWKKAKGPAVSELSDHIDDIFTAIALNQEIPVTMQ